MTTTNLDGILGALSSKQAPAVVGKPVYEKDLEVCKYLGYAKLTDIFGKRVDEKSNEVALPINFGSRKSAGQLPDDVRFRLFNFKKMLHNLEVQAAYAFRGQHITPEMLKTLPIYKDYIEGLCKAYNLTNFADWVPTVQARFYFEEFELPYILADQFDRLPMDSMSMEVPGDMGHLFGVEEDDDAVFTAKKTTAAKYTVTARGNVAHAVITQDLMSDSAPSYIEKLRREVAMATVRSYEHAIINGDTSETGGVRGDNHMDSDIRALPINGTFAKAFKGLRKKAFDNAAAGVVYDHQGDTASKEMFAELLQRMGKFASVKTDLIWIMSSTIENQVVTGAIPELFTAYAFGGVASNVSGEMPPIFGVKSVVSEHVREDLNASGVYDGTTKNKTCVLCVKKSRFAQFWRQALRIWAAPSLPSSDTMLMTSKCRHTFNGNPQSADEKSVAMAINVALVATTP